MHKYVPFKTCDTEDDSKLQHSTRVAFNRYPKNTLTQHKTSSNYALSILLNLSVLAHKREHFLVSNVNHFYTLPETMKKSHRFNPRQSTV